MHALWPLSSSRRWEVGRAAVEASWALLCLEAFSVKLWWDRTLDPAETNSENALPLTYGKQSGQEFWNEME
jgi:hypothetical protein